MTSSPTRAEIICRLTDLRCHCESMADPDEPDDIWQEDVEALDAAIRELRMNEHTEPSPGLHFKPREEQESVDDQKTISPDDTLSYRAIASLIVFLGAAVLSAIAALCAIATLLLSVPIRAVTFFWFSICWWAVALTARRGIPG